MTSITASLGFVGFRISKQQSCKISVPSSSVFRVSQISLDTRQNASQKYKKPAIIILFTKKYKDGIVIGTVSADKSDKTIDLFFGPGEEIEFRLQGDGNVFICGYTTASFAQQQPPDADEKEDEEEEEEKYPISIGQQLRQKRKVGVRPGGYSLRGTGTVKDLVNDDDDDDDDDDMEYIHVDEDDDDDEDAGDSGDASDDEKDEEPLLFKRQPVEKKVSINMNGNKKRGRLIVDALEASSSSSSSSGESSSSSSNEEEDVIEGIPPNNKKRKKISDEYPLLLSTSGVALQSSSNKKSKVQAGKEKEKKKVVGGFKCNQCSKILRSELSRSQHIKDKHLKK